jgi:hypothetical protein
MSPAERSLFYRRAALAPLCLCLVAGLHVARVWTAGQTPWKGGGFGMFSTVDDESARFVRCYLVTDDDEIPLPVPPAAEKFVAELRAAPTQARLDELARRLAGQSWRWRNERQGREAAAIAAADGSKITSAVFQADAKPADHADTSQKSAGASKHILEPIPRDAARRDAVAFTGVRIQCLKYHYDARGRVLAAKELLSARTQRTVEEQEADE